MKSLDGAGPETVDPIVSTIFCGEIVMVQLDKLVFKKSAPTGFVAFLTPGIVLAVWYDSDSL